VNDIDSFVSCRARRGVQRILPGWQMPHSCGRWNRRHRTTERRQTTAHSPRCRIVRVVQWVSVNLKFCGFCLFHDTFPSHGTTVRTYPAAHITSPCERGPLCMVQMVLTSLSESVCGAHLPTWQRNSEWMSGKQGDNSLSLQNRYERFVVWLRHFLSEFRENKYPYFLPDVLLISSPTTTNDSGSFSSES
jgi:hypothetical protein